MEFQRTTKKRERDEEEEEEKAPKRPFVEPFTRKFGMDALSQLEKEYENFCFRPSYPPKRGEERLDVYTRTRPQIERLLRLLALQDDVLEVLFEEDESTYALPSTEKYYILEDEALRDKKTVIATVCNFVSTYLGRKRVRTLEERFPRGITLPAEMTRELLGYTSVMPFIYRDVALQRRQEREKLVETLTKWIVLSGLPIGDFRTGIEPMYWQLRGETEDGGFFDIILFQSYTVFGDISGFNTRTLLQRLLPYVDAEDIKGGEETVKQSKEVPREIYDKLPFRIYMDEDPGRLVIDSVPPRYLRLIVDYFLQRATQIGIVRPYTLSHYQQRQRPLDPLILDWDSTQVLEEVPYLPINRALRLLAAHPEAIETIKAASSRIPATILRKREPVRPYFDWDYQTYLAAFGP